LGAKPEHVFPVIGPLRVHAAQDGLRVGLQTPSDRVFDLLGRVRLCSADLLTASVASATVVGCRLCDLTNGWGGHPGGEVLRPGRVHSCHHTEIVHS
jgi:hypothetical protein